MGLGYIKMTCYELSFKQLLCVAFAHGTLRDIQCATCEKRTNLSLPASFQKIMLAFIRDPVVFNKTIIPVARCTLLGSALPQRALLAILCNNLEGNYMRTGRTEAGTKLKVLLSFTWDRDETLRWLHETGTNSKTGDSCSYITFLSFPNWYTIYAN